jgi:hypothetical protein
MDPHYHPQSTYYLYNEDLLHAGNIIVYYAVTET